MHKSCVSPELNPLVYQIYTVSATPAQQILPSIPWGGFLHSDSPQLPDQFLAASPYRLSEFGEGAAALQVTESILPAVLSAGPAGTTLTWRSDRQSDERRQTEYRAAHCHQMKINDCNNKNVWSVYKPQSSTITAFAVRYLRQIQTPSRALWSGSLCKELQLVGICPA